MHCSKCNLCLHRSKFSTRQKRKSAKVRSCKECMVKVSPVQQVYYSVHCIDCNECFLESDLSIQRCNDCIEESDKLELVMSDAEYSDYIDFGPSHIFVAEYMERQWEEDEDYGWNDDGGYDYSHDI